MPSPHPRFRPHHLIPIVMAALLAACGGGGGDGDDSGSANPPPTTEEPGPGTTPPTEPNPNPNPNPGPSPDDQTIQGAIVVPEGAQATTARVLASASPTAMAAATCPDVPIGYVPVANAAISFTTQDDQPSGVTAQTDDCGQFSASVPANVVKATATASGYRTITVPVTTFTQAQGNTPPLLSVLPDVPNAGYEIASLQWTDARLYFTVVDTLTNKAVLGLPQSAVTYRINGGDAGGLKTMNYAASQDGADASIALALDGSSSMDNLVYYENGTILTRFSLATRAAHTFLDGKRANDEVGIVAFDHAINWIDKSYLDGAGLVTGAAGAQTDYLPPYDASGFNRSANDLRLPVDYYNYRSALWRQNNPDPLHASLPDTLARKSAARSYPWNGRTAAYDAADVGLQKVQTRSNTRKIVVLMTDGADNESRLNPDAVIANFRQANVPLWTVAFSASAQADTLQRMATETGGQYVSSVEQSRLIAAFAAMQTGIVFQYIGELQQASLPANASLELTLNHGALNISRSLTLQ